MYTILLAGKDTDLETDGISIISESERSNDLEQPLSLAVSKEKKYLHHPNTYLNTRLNVLLALSFAAVTGLGLGHFLGNSALHIDRLCENILCVYMYFFGILIMIIMEE